MAGTLQQGTLVGDRYVVEELIGQGGFGEVYSATNRHMGNRCALKVLHAADVPPPEVERFEREARTTCQLTSPYNIRVFDFGRTKWGDVFMAMELLKGRTLSSLMRETGALEPARATRFAVQILKALVEAHGLGMIHRDLKPANIFMTEVAGEPEFVKVLDFGIAKLMDTNTATLTAKGLVVGTPTYMAPEQASGRTIDERADLYAVGVMLYEMLAGRPPFTAKSPTRIVMMHINEAPPPLLEQPGAGAVPPPLAGVVHRLLEKLAENRFPSAAATIVALESAGLGTPKPFAAPVNLDPTMFLSSDSHPIVGEPADDSDGNTLRVELVREEEPAATVFLSDTGKRPAVKVGTNPAVSRMATGPIAMVAAAKSSRADAVPRPASGVRAAPKGTPDSGPKTAFLDPDAPDALSSRADWVKAAATPKGPVPSSTVERDSVDAVSGGSRRGLWIGLGAVGLVAASVGGYFATRKNDPPAEPAPRLATTANTPPEAKAPSAPPKVTAPAQPSPAASPKPIATKMEPVKPPPPLEPVKPPPPPEPVMPPPPPAPPAPEITIDSVPRGAIVTHGGKPLGPTPVSLKAATAGSVERIELRADGHRTVNASIGANRTGAVVVQLVSGTGTDTLPEPLAVLKSADAPRIVEHLSAGGTYRPPSSGAPTEPDGYPTVTLELPAKPVQPKPPPPTVKPKPPPVAKEVPAKPKVEKPTTPGVKKWD